MNNVRATLPKLSRNPLPLSQGFQTKRKQQRSVDKADYERRVKEAESNHRKKLEVGNRRDDARRKATQGSVVFPNAVVRSWGDRLEERKGDGAPGPETNDSDLDLKEHVFRSLKSNVITLQWKGLNEFPSDLNTTLLTQFNKIRQVFLCGNHLRELPPWTKRHFRAIMTLNVSHNRLICLPDSITTLDTLRLLILDNNCIEVLPDEFGSIHTLEELRINDNALRSFPRSFGQLKNLKNLEASRNQLEEIPLCLSRLSKLEALSLNNNAISSFAFMAPPELPYKSRTITDSRLEEDMPEHTDAVRRKLQTGKRMMEERRQLAEDGVAIWTCRMDYDTGTVYFVNNVLKTEQTEIPRDLDKLGEMSQLKRLSLKSNAISNIPDSIGRLTELRELFLDGNKICRLPGGVAKCRRLQHLSLSDNLLTEVADDIAELTLLEKLNVAKNAISSVSTRLAELPNLSGLWLAANNLRSVPSNLCRLEQAETLDLIGNPLETPFDALLNAETLQDLLWQLRQINLLKTRGRLPQVRQVCYGIEKETRDTNIHFDAKMQRELEEAMRTNQLSLAWRGLENMPRGFWRLRKLRELHLVGNAFSLVPEEILCLAQLKILNLRKNKLIEIGPGLRGLHSLEALLLEDNRIQYIHEDIGKLPYLTTLRLSGNILESLPQALARCVRLGTLEVDVNHLGVLPNAFEKLSVLRVLKLGKNRLNELPVSLFRCPLQYLNLNLNGLHTVPAELYMSPSMGSLVELHLSHNHLTHLPEDFGDGSLQLSLQVMWIYANRIEELPLSVQHLTQLKDMRIENNGMRSPPEELAVHGAQRIVAYCKERSRRMEAVKQQLTTAGFEIDPTRLRPKTEALITGSSGRLATVDLEVFYERVDAFVNGPLCETEDVDGKVLVGSLATLREQRLASFRRIVLLRLLVVLELLQTQRRLCRRAYFNPRFKWQWSRFQTSSECYALNLDVLFEDQHAPEQEAIQKLLRQAQSTRKREVDLDFIAFHGEDIPITLECIEDALDNFVDPLHGKISTSSAMISLTGRGEGSPRKAAVLNKVIYTEEEAIREKEEFDSVLQHTKMAMAALEEWFQSVDSVVKIKLEVNRRRDALKAAVVSHKQRLKDAESALRKAKKNKQRARAYSRSSLKGKAKSTKKLDAMRVNEEVRTAENELRLAYEERKEARRRLKDKAEKWAEECKSELRKRVERMAARNRIRAGRQKAYKLNLRRPWDGKNGIKYHRWRNMKDALALEMDPEQTQARKDTSEEVLLDYQSMPRIYYGWSEPEDEDTDEELEKVFEETEHQSSTSEDDDDDSWSSSSSGSSETSNTGSEGEEPENNNGG